MAGIVNQFMKWIYTLLGFDDCDEDIIVPKVKTTNDKALNYNDFARF